MFDIKVVRSPIIQYNFTVHAPHTLHPTTGALYLNNGHMGFPLSVDISDGEVRDFGECNLNKNEMNI